MKELIQWSEIDLKNKTSGAIKALCPKCSHTRKKKNDPCLSVNIDKGMAKCWNCEAISIRDIQEKKTYNTPPQNWQNYTSLSKQFVDFFQSRGISQKTIIENRITQETSFIPNEGSKVLCIAFNYFEGGKLLNKKFRSLKKGFMQVKDAKKVFYGLNDIVGCDEVYIVEGEMDKLAMYEHGIKNCISVPNGANDLNDIFQTCENYLKDIKKFFIAVDMDEPGEKLEKELIKRLGKHRCERIQFSGKDANEDLVNLKIEAALKNPKPYPVEGTFTANDVAEEINNLWENGFEKPLKPKGQQWRELNKIFSTLLGQLTVVTGIPTHGKSNFIEDYLINLANDNDLKLSFYSPEHLPMEMHHAQLIEKYTGKPFFNSTLEVEKVKKSEIEAYKNWSAKSLFLTVPEKGVTADWDWLIETFKQQIFRFGIDVFCIDAFNKVRKKNSDSLGELSEILSRLTLFCQQYNVSIFLVAHPTKMQKDESGVRFKIPTLYDVKGSGDFYDQTHNGLTIYRYFENEANEFVGTIAIPMKLKFKHQGKVGEQARFNFNPNNGRYYSFGTMPNNEMINPIELPQIEPNKEFWNEPENNLF